MESGANGKTVCLSNEELKKIYFGGYSFRETEDGWLQAFQYTEAQMEYFRKTSDFWYDRCMASTAKTLEFVTDADFFSLDYKIIWKGSLDSFETAVDGLVTQIWYLKDLEDEGSIRCGLPEGRKTVTFYLPADATVLIRNFACGAEVRPAAKGKKVLWLGDSITQGFGPLRSSCTYVSVANRLLNYDLINQGIGGYVYDKNSLMKMEGYEPERIIVALGTNQYGAETMKDVEEYYATLMKVYGDRIPVLCISPLWRGDSPEGIPTLKRFCENVKRIAGTCANVTVADGFRMVPHLPEYFLDNLHPNALGAEVYGRNLAEFIRETGF